MLGRLGGKAPKFYGSVTVAERGQGKKALMLVKAESITEFMAHATTMLSHFEQILKSNLTETSKDNC